MTTGSRKATYVQPEDNPDVARSAARLTELGTLRWLPLAVVGAVALAFLEKVVHSSWSYWMEDFNVERMAASILLHHGGIYHFLTPERGLAYTHTPFAAVVFIPFTIGSFGVAAVAWCAFEAFFLELAAWLTLGAVGVCGPATRAVLSVVIAFASLLLDPVDSDLSLGQLNILLMFLVLLDVAYGLDRRWRGVGIGVAAGIKLVPLVFVVYLVLTRQLRAAAVAFGTFVGTVAVGFAVLPADSVEYWRGGGLDLSRIGSPQSPFNQSLRGLFARLTHTGATVSPTWLLADLVVAVIGLWIAVLAYRRGETLAAALCCALTSVLVSPVAWEHYWVWSVPLLIMVGAWVGRYRSVAAGLLFAVVAATFGLRLLHWYVPVDDTLDLHLSVPRQLAADCFPLLGLVLLVVLAIVSGRTWRTVPT